MKMKERTPGQIQFDEMYDSVMDTAIKFTSEMWINSKDTILVSLTVPTSFKALLENFAKISSKMTEGSTSAAEVESSFFMDLILLGLRNHVMNGLTEDILKAMEALSNEKTDKN
jgi:hypothetical protein